MSFSHISRFYNTGGCTVFATWRQVSSLKIYKRFLPLCWEAGVAVRCYQPAVMPVKAHQPICTRKRHHHCIRWPSSVTCTRASFSTTLNSELFACFRRKPWNWIFPSRLFLCLRLSTSSGYPTCSPCLGSGVTRTDAVPTYAIPNSFLTQATIKCSMSWRTIQLGLEEPGWKLHSLHCMVYYELFPWCIYS